MSTVAQPPSMIAPAQSPVAVPLASLPLRRITVDEYERIGDSGALDDPERVELIDGYLVTKMPKKPGHSFSTTKTYEVVTARLPAGWSARKEEPVRMPTYDEPEPDISVVRGTADDYRQRHPGPTEVGLLVEVSSTTLDLDRGQKLSAYATHSIPVYWIINLVDLQVEVYTDPGPGAYRSRTRLQAGPGRPHRARRPASRRHPGC